MYDELKNAANRVVGLKQVLRELQSQKVECVYLAEDAEERIKNRVKRAAGLNIGIIAVPSMSSLGEACGIAVGAACAAILK